MSTAMNSILRAATRCEDDRLYVLTYATHERFQTGWSDIDATFYLVSTPQSKTWDTTYAPVPNNHIIVDTLPLGVDFDVVISQNKHAHYDHAVQLCRQLHLPLISLEHCLPPDNAPAEYLRGMKERRGDLNVFISEYSRKAWGWSDNEALVIHHGVDTGLFKPDPTAERTPHALSVVNDWINREIWCGYSLWRYVSRDLPVKVLGKTPGLSEPAKDVHDLVRHYQASQVFLNTSLVSPVPTALLEAMACGCAVVSTATAMIPEVIEHGVNGLLSNDPNELRAHTLALLHDAGLAARLGEAARQTIVERFSMGAFQSNWEAVLRTAADIPFQGTR